MNDEFITPFSNAPNRTFMGLDRHHTHSFTVPRIVNTQLIDHFDLRSGNLQEEIVLLIDGNPHLAEVRLARINRSRPYRLAASAIPKGEVLKIQWSKFDLTKQIFREKLTYARDIVLSGKVNKSQVVQFTHRGENFFEIDISYSR
jgi:hypothetical protein